MVVIGLLLVALVCLALGLVLASPGWLIGSLVVTAIAAVLMWIKRPAAESAAAAAESAPPVSERPVPSADPVDAAEAVDTEYQQRPAAWLAESAAPGDVWVIDGRPEYHATGCGVMLGEKAEPVPLAQAIEDGFTPCPACRPGESVPTDAVPTDAVPSDAVPSDAVPSDAVPSDAVPSDAVPTDPESAPGDEVWVIDGRPEYHRSGATDLGGADAEPIPLAQASEDGFTPCPQCYPPAVSGAAPTPSGTTQPAEPVRPVPTPQEAAARDRTRSQVWVVDGRPRFHRSDCMIIKGQDAEPIPLEQATEDGFMACSLCEPNALDR